MLSILLPLDAKLKLQRLLYEFKEPFDKEQARRDWSYGWIAKLTKESLLFYYLQLFSLFIEINKTVFDPYKQYDTSFVEPDSAFVNSYCGLIIPVLKAFRLQRQLREVPEINLTSFETLNGDYNRLIKDWHDQKGSFADTRATINKLWIQNNGTQYHIPFRLQEIFNEMHTHIANHRIKQKKQSMTPGNVTTDIPLPDDFQWDTENKLQYDFGTRGRHIFTKTRNNKRLVVFTMIIDKRGEYISLQKIADKIRKDNHYVRSVITQLNEELKQFSVFIELDGKGFARFVIQPQKLA